MEKNPDSISSDTALPESTIVANHQGKDISQLRHTWQAQWITHPTASTSDFGVFLFRRLFEIAKKPDKFLVYISADNRYRLFINGTAVCFGPAIGDISHYRYETIDISQYLETGKNIIAAEVVNFGEFKRGAQQSYMTAFILQGDRELPISINTGEPGWKVLQNNAYEYIPFLPKDLNAYYCAGPGDKIYGETYPWNWEKPGYNDTRWLEPRFANVEFAVGRGFIFGSTWFLVPRKIPLMEETPQRFSRIVRTRGMDISNDFIKGKKPILISPNTLVTILFDQGVHTVAFPELIINGGKGSKIKITYAEALFRRTKKDKQKSDEHVDRVDKKGNRNETKGKEIFGVYDIIYPDGGENRLFRPLWKRTFRYVQLDIETSFDTLELRDYSSIYTVYPFKEVAHFKSDDPELSKIWEVAWRTLRNGSGEIFQDTPYYEQMQYIGDTRISALISLYVAGDDRLMRKAIEQFDDSRIPEGLTQSRYPAYIQQIIPPFSLYWIGMLHDYHMYQNDPDFIRRFLPGMRGVLEWFEEYVDNRGLLTRLEWWNFTDWSDGFENGVPPGVDNGSSANISLQYVYALNHAVQLFDYFGWDYEGKKYENLRDRIGKAANDYCYNAQKGLFAETPEKDLFSQHTNIMSILSDAVEADTQKKIMKKLLYDRSLIQTTLYFKFYLFRALQKTGLSNEYLNQLAPWKHMLDTGLTTFPETEGMVRSDCHAWSATPCFDFLHTVAGIYPAEPGFKAIMIEPNFGYLRRIDVQMPHPSGELIKVNLEKHSYKGIKGSISLPRGLDGVFIWNNIKHNLVNGTQTIVL